MTSMKKWIYIFFAAMISVQMSAVTVMVMDTTQALLPNAEVKAGRTVLHTSFDGKVELNEDQIPWTKRISVSCEGYKKQRVKVNHSNELIIIQLVPKKQRANTLSHKTFGLSSHSAKDGIYYTLSAAPRTAGMESKLAVDYAMPEEAEMHILPYYGEPANDVSAGKLTAGEVNDFAKWSLWQKVLNDTHKQFVSVWGIAPRQRYTVQVMDKYGYPIVNYPVNLTDKNGNTLFQTLTDNTGKAELWSGLLTNTQQAEVSVPQSTLVVDEPCDVPGGVDVFFIFDATGSMGDELSYLQAEMTDVIARAKDATGGLDIRTGAVVYRDHGDEYITRISRLTEDISTTQAFIDKQEADGGGDYEEAVPEALMAALNSAGWDENARARIAFLILDAPCHEDSATLALMHDQILNAASMGVRIVPVVCSGIGESAEYLLRSIALATNGTSFFLTDDSGIGNPHLKPTTDSLKVEHLNDMLVRTIVEFSYMPDCRGKWHMDEIEKIDEDFIPNPFDAQDLVSDPSIPHGPTTLYLLDVSGKLITIYQGNLEDAGDYQLGRLGIRLTTGVYFIKAFYDGEWHTKKLLVH